ncbi:MAG: hypothetical protein NTV88_02165 [Candidatus Micrarchaeota archaeon]|nr:hypothetical protein [Candidatus Micrarchaeota archaeon]
MSGKRAQIAPEAVLIAAVMMFLLLAMFIVSVHLSSQWDVEKQRLQASSAGNSLARAINSIAAGGNGASVYYFNSVGPDVANMSIYQGRSLRVYYKEGGYETVALVTSNTGSDAATIPLNSELWITDTEGFVYIAGVLI